MPCLAITFGQAPQAAHRRFSQFATMASRTRIAGRLAGLDFNTFSARLTPFRQALVAFRSITTRNIKRTQLLAEPSPLEVRALGAFRHIKRNCASKITRSPKACSIPVLGIVCGFWGCRSDTRLWCDILARQCSPSDIGHLAHWVAA